MQNGENSFSGHLQLVNAIDNAIISTAINCK